MSGTREQKQLTNRETSANNTRRPCAWGLLIFVVLLTSLVSQPQLVAASTSEKAKEIVEETTEAVERAGDAAADTARNLWQRIDDARLKNRTPDELVAWVIMGVLVGSVAGMMTKLKPTPLGKLGRLLLGLSGAFLGGIVASVGQFDFGWGPVLIRYEELFFSLVGAVLLVLLGKIIGSRKKRKDASQSGASGR